MSARSIEDEVDEIKLKIYEEIKDMTAQERREYYHRKCDDTIKKYGLKVIHSPEELDRVQ